MRKTRKCAFCGKEFTCNSGSQRFCSEHCAEAAKAQRKKRQQDFLKALQPVIDIASQEYLTFSKAAILMGCSRQYVYKLVNEGKLPASRISNRMAFIRKADIEKMLAGNPYHRVLPGTPTNKPFCRQQTFCPCLLLPTRRQANFRRHFLLPTLRHAASSVKLSAKLANNPQFQPRFIQIFTKTPPFESIFSSFYTFAAAV